MMEYRELSEQEYRDLQSRILYEDNHLLVVNKRCGEIVQGDKTGDETLADAYKAFIARRDGKPGKVTVLAKTSKCLERMNEAFRNGSVHKTYWALCCAAPETKEALLENWLLRNEGQNKSYIVREGNKQAKLARLQYRYLGPTERYHVLEVALLTGRHHQIRCQLAGIGCPIKGDLKYGAPRSNPDGGISLHARNIRFVHPVQKTEISITAPLPASWKGIERFTASTHE